MSEKSELKNINEEEKGDQKKSPENDNIETNPEKDTGDTTGVRIHR